MARRRAGDARPIIVGVRATLPAATFVVAAACGLVNRPAGPRQQPPLAALTLTADSTAVDTIAPGAVAYRFIIARGPWAIYVLDVDRAACWTPVAFKPTRGAVGRTRASVAVESLSSRRPGTRGRPGVAGAVNADFFLFGPPGLPVGAFVHGGQLIAGPVDRPVLAIDSAGAPWIGRLGVDGRAWSGADTLAVQGWNRPLPAGLSFFDAAYGARLDTASGALRIVLDGVQGGAVVAVDTSGGPTIIPPRGSVLSAGVRVPAATRARLLVAATARRHIDVAVHLTPVAPREAVGGFPVLVRDSVEVAGLDSAGPASFAPVRHPRTIVAISAAGRRLLLIAVDGRRPGYSAGMTLRESAWLARALGATDAINLDGGGSTTLVVARRTASRYRYVVANTPSDSAGERPVGNVLAIEAHCR